MLLVSIVKFALVTPASFIWFLFRWLFWLREDLDFILTGGWRVLGVLVDQVALFTTGLASLESELVNRLIVLVAYDWTLWWEKSFTVILSLVLLLRVWSILRACILLLSVAVLGEIEDFRACIRTDGWWSDYNARALDFSAEFLVIKPSTWCSLADIHRVTLKRVCNVG